MSRALLSASFSLLLAAACSGAPSESADAPATEALPLEKRILSVKEGDINGRKVTKHFAAFGNWVAECTWSRGPQDLSFCDVYPWNGKLPKRSTVLTPFSERATVQYYEQQAAKIVLHTKPRAEGTDLAYECGYTKWKGAETADKVKYFYNDDAQRFTFQMKSTDCVISYTPAGATEPVEITRTAHGFRAANEYASNFSQFPKPVEAQPEK